MTNKADVFAALWNITKSSPPRYHDMTYTLDTRLTVRQRFQRCKRTVELSCTSFDVDYMLHYATVIIPLPANLLWNVDLDSNLTQCNVLLILSRCSHPSSEWPARVGTYLALSQQEQLWYQRIYKLWRNDQCVGWSLCFQNNSISKDLQICSYWKSDWCSHTIQDKMKVSRKMIQSINVNELKSKPSGQWISQAWRDIYI